MIDVNWDLAPEGAEELVQFETHVTWRKGIKIWCMVQEGWRDYISDFKAIATRPTQTKTVADAVEYYGETFVAGQWTHIRCGKDGKMFFASGETDSDNWQGSYLVCTREQFEAYVKEQEGEKWTHDLWGDKAYIKIAEPDCDGYLLVITEGNGYNLAKMEDLKPIKPTLSESEAWRKARDGHPVEFIMGKYNVVEG